MRIEIVRPYGGQEGARVRRGTLFHAPGATDAGEGSTEISRQRCIDLLNARIAVRLDQPSIDAAPGARPSVGLRPAAPASRDLNVSRGPKKKRTAPEQPAGEKVVVPRPPRRRQQAEPAPPRRIDQGSAPTGSPTGQDASPSSLQADHPSEASTSEPLKKKRGRRSGGSPSTTAGDSPNSPTSTTPPTSDGGDNTDPPSPDEDEVLE